ncbi:NERD domain-containing protein [Actinomadura sp. LCR2-06]|uniref:NERD domain-containing protein n=1 Tax=Actinomadura violacea TaxID=2819934 RepID=A0ABS3S9N8_9ACTN|nr:NERD domain-containing protein [Actinomadura violacea]
MGAKAERVIGGRLDKWARKHGWHVLHAVPVGRRGADIDHVLIGPFGVVTINTKSTRGKVWVAENGMMVGGTKVDYLRNSRPRSQARPKAPRRRRRTPRPGATGRRLRRREGLHRPQWRSAGRRRPPRRACLPPLAAAPRPRPHP